MAPNYGPKIPRSQNLFEIIDASNSKHTSGTGNIISGVRGVIWQRMSTVTNSVEDGVYVRGRLKDSNVIVLPDYWTGLVYEDSITVNLTAIGSKQSIWVEDIRDNCVIIGSDGPINCFYTINATRKDVEAFEVEYKDK